MQLLAPARAAADPWGASATASTTVCWLVTGSLTPRCPGASIRPAKRAATSPALCPSLKCARTRLLLQWLLQLLKASFASIWTLSASVEKFTSCFRKSKERKDYTFWGQSNEKPSVILGCPGSSSNTNCQRADTRSNALILAAALRLVLNGSKWGPDLLVYTTQCHPCPTRLP